MGLRMWKCCWREGPQHLRALGLVPLSRHEMCRDARALGGIHGIDLPPFTPARGSWHLDKASAFETRLSSGDGWRIAMSTDRLASKWGSSVAARAERAGEGVGMD